jgi:hypothetical protein
LDWREKKRPGRKVLGLRTLPEEPAFDAVLDEEDRVEQSWY